jgi:hypothetical protein
MADVRRQVVVFYVATCRHREALRACACPIRASCTSRLRMGESRVMANVFFDFLHLSINVRSLKPPSKIKGVYIVIYLVSIWIDRSSYSRVSK